MYFPDRVEPPPDACRAEEHRLVFQKGANGLDLGGEGLPAVILAPLDEQPHVGEVGLDRRGRKGPLKALEFRAPIVSSVDTASLKFTHMI